MKQDQLIPKRRRKRQPSADLMREQLRLAADEIINLRTQIAWRDAHSGPIVWRMPPLLTRAQSEASVAAAFRILADPISYTGRTTVAPPPPTRLQRLWHRIVARLRKGE